MQSPKRTPKQEAATRHWRLLGELTGLAGWIKSKQSILSEVPGLSPITQRRLNFALRESRFQLDRAANEYKMFARKQKEKEKELE